MEGSFMRLMVSAIVCFVIGMHLILQARRIRRKLEEGFEKRGGLYRLLLFGDWILRFPRAHIAWIRLGGVAFVLLSVLLVAWAFSTR